MEKNTSPKKSYNFDYNNKIELPSDNIYIQPKWGLENINIVQITDEIHINKNEDLESNYLFKTFLENKSNNIFILILLPIIIISEIFYREPLFSFSLKFELNLQKYLSDNSLIFFRFITKAGCEYFIVIALIIIFLYFSLIQTIICFFGLTISIYMQSLMKMIYGSSRPFLENNKLYNGMCDGGFGNPSGHALVSFYIYLTLIKYIKNYKYFNELPIIKILFTILLWMMLILVIISRIILGLHSINQIIYGSFLGIWIYYVLIHIFKLHKISMITYRKIYQNIKYIFFNSLFFILSILIAILCYFNFNQNLDYIDLHNKLNYDCGRVKKFRRFNNDGIFGCLIIISFIGLYYGQFLFWSFSDKYYKKNMNKLNNNDYYLIDELINNWNKNKCFLFHKKSNLFTIIKTIVVCSLPLPIFFFISSDDDSMLKIFLIKFTIPIFFTSFIAFGIGLYWFIIMFCGNKENLINNYYQFSIDDL